MCAPTKHFFDIQRAHTVRPLYMALMRFLIKVKRHDLPDVSNACKYKKTASLTLTVFGRGRRIRTLGTRFWRPLLYQLSYAPMKNTHDAIFRIVGIILELLSRFELLTSSLPRMRSTS